MESVLVNARVPVAKRDAAKAVLESMGKTTTDLINSAYDYLLSERQLPGAGLAAGSHEERLDDFRCFLDEATCPVDWGERADWDYKDLLTEALEEKYGSIA